MADYQAPEITAIGLVSEVTLEQGSQGDSTGVIN